MTLSLTQGKISLTQGKTKLRNIQHHKLNRFIIRNKGGDTK